MANRPTEHARAEAAFAEFRHNGSPRAMAEVFDRTATGLLLFARRFTRDAASAEDLVQQTFLRAIERADTFAPGSPLMPWLTSILANEARMELRRTRTPEPERIAQSASEEPWHAAGRREAAAAMHQALAQLPPAYRDVVALRFLHDMRPGHIATALAVPLPTVKTRLHRGMRKLAASLPRGLALGTAVALSAGRGLPACRRAVARAAGASTAATWTLIGVLAMKKTVLPIIAGLVLLAALWLLLPVFLPGNQQDATPGALVATGLPAAGGAAAAHEPAGNDPADGSARTPVETPAPERASRADAIEVRAHWRSSGQPAARIPFTLLVQPYDWLASETTDDAGCATFDLGRHANLANHAPHGLSVTCALQPGRYENVRLDRGEVSPRVVEFALEDGRQVAGTVVDARNTRVAGASVWLAVDQYQPAVLLAHTDAAGHFLLRGLSPAFSIRATHGGAASSAVTAAQFEGAGEIVLRLTTAAARLEVLVTNASGTPLARAAALLDDRNRGSANQHWFATSGDDGRACLDGIGPGKYQLEVVHPSFPPAQLEITIASATEERREAIQLGPGADVEGRVRLGNGNAVAGASVMLGYDAGSMLQRWTHTDQEGRFRLERVAIGRHLISISQAVPEFRRYLDLHAGPQTLELVVPGSNRIAGRLVDPEDRALAGWSVHAQPTSGFEGMTTYTGSDGRFAFDVVSEGAWLLAVGRERAVTTFTDVATDGSERVYRLPATVMPRAFVVGRIEGDQECSLVLWRRDRVDMDGDRHWTVPADGRFEFGPLPPVAHDVGIQVGANRRTWWLTTANLADNERCDLGTIRLPEPGTLEVTVRDSLGCERLSVSVRPAAMDGNHGQGLEQLDREHWRAVDLPPGEYDVCLNAEATAPVKQRIAVASSQTNRVTLITAPGAVLAYRLAPPAGVPDEAIGVQDVTIREQSGNAVVRTRMMGSLAHRLRLLEGSYTLEVATGGGFRGNTQLVVPPDSNAEVQVRIAR